MALQLLEVEAWISRRLFEREITAPASPVMARQPLPTTMVRYLLSPKKCRIS